jgi:hypothetical protein
MLYSRYLGLATFIVLIIVVLCIDKDKNWKNKLKTYGMMFLEGMVGGFIIDAIGISAGYYYFPRQPFLSAEYFAIVIPCWGVFGMLINCLWSWVGKEKFWKGMVVTLVPLFAWYEGTNLISHSWVYTTSFWAVGLGWVPLIWTFAGCNRRRRVVHKIEEWKMKFQEDKFSHSLIYCSLSIARVLLTVAMFPLLLAVLARLCFELPMLIKRDISVWVYFKYLVAME